MPTLPAIAAAVTGESPVTMTVRTPKSRNVTMSSAESSRGGSLSTDDFGVFARIDPEGKYRLVQALQRHGHAVGMCGDGTNDAPAMRQAQMGIAVSTATDVAKAAAGMVLTEPGLAGVVYAIREGRVAFQRLLAYTFPWPPR